MVTRRKSPQQISNLHSAQGNGPRMCSGVTPPNVGMAGSVSSARNVGASRFSAANPRINSGSAVFEVAPATNSRESGRAWSNRINRSSDVERGIASSRRRMLALCALVLAVTVVVAMAVSSAVFRSEVNNKFLLAPEASELLAPVPDQGGYYTLITGRFTQEGVDGPDAALLLYLDSDNNLVTVVSIPGSLMISCGEDEYCTFDQAYGRGGDALVIQSVKDLLGVDICHYASIDAKAFVNLVNAVGTLPISLSRDVSDPDAGDYALEPGLQNVDGDQALFLCRANDFGSSADTVRAEHISMVVSQLFVKLEDLNASSIFKMLDGLEGSFVTDMEVKDALSFLDSISFVTGASVQTAVVPCDTDTLPGTYDSCLVADADAWHTMNSRICQGLSPVQDRADQIGSVLDQDLTIEVLNGGTITGAAAHAAGVLEEWGFTVESTGNAPVAIYDETLVAYWDEGSEAYAEAIVSALGIGRAVYEPWAYVYTTDVKVLIGEDYVDVINGSNS